MNKQEKLEKIKELSANHERLAELAERQEHLDNELNNLEEEAKSLRESIAEPLKAIKESVKSIKMRLAGNRHEMKEIIKKLLTGQELQGCLFDIPEFSDTEPVTQVATSEAVTPTKESKKKSVVITEDKAINITRMNF